MPAKHGITTNQSEYLSYIMVKPFDLLKQHGTNKCMVEISYITVVLYIGITKVWDFMPQKITPKLACYVLCDTQVALVMHSLVQKCRLDLFTNQCHFILRRAFLPTATAPMLASWLYQSLPLFTILFSTTVKVTIFVVHVLWLQCKTRVVQYQQGCFLCCSLLNARSSWKQSIVIHCG